MSYDPRSEFGIPGTFDPTEEWPEDERHLHEGGLDGIAPAYDPVRSALTGAIGFDPADIYDPSLATRQDVEHNLPQWGPPFIAFVDGRISDLEKQVNKAIEKWSFQTTTDVFMASMTTNGSGVIDPNLNDKATLYEPPPGFTFALHRLIIRDTAHTFGTPFTGAGAWWELRINGETVDGNSMIAGQGQLPVVGTWGTRDALRVRDGQVLSLFMNAGPISTSVFVLGQGSLDRTIEG